MPQWEDEYANDMYNHELQAIKQSTKQNTMTPVQCLYKKLMKSFRFTHNPTRSFITISLDVYLKAFDQCMQMEAEQMKIPELSDEEIENLCQSTYGAYDEHDEFDNGLREGMKLYREQLKQRQ